MTTPTDLEREVARAIRVELNRQTKDGSLAYYNEHFGEVDGAVDIDAVARAAIEACFRWRPIETAPTETPIQTLSMMDLDRDDTPTPVPSIYRDGKWYLLDDNGDIVVDGETDSRAPFELLPTHWLPLPPSPEPKDGK